MKQLIANTSPSFSEMQDSINKAGGVFCQYRPCRRNAATIYDIENIRHGVVYAQTPLNMNDPFDSMIGFSADEFFDDCIDQIIDAVTINDPRQKTLISLLLKYKVLGKMGESIQFLNKLKEYLFSKQKSMHMLHVNVTTFISQNMKELYSKCPKDIKQRISSLEFAFYAHIVSNMDRVAITAQNISDMYKMDAVLQQLYDRAVEIRDKTYLPGIQSFLSRLTVSCFSASGWNNQLMWAHYANSYTGICIEYDFSQIKDFNGFIYPVHYSNQRPTLKLKDLGIHISSSDGKATLDQNDADMNAILAYLLYKNTCWSYEEEWRIINVGEEYTPIFVDLPYIKSITFGLDVDPICKQLLWDVCNEKNIPCYQLTASIESYELKRHRLTEEDFPYDIDKAAEYVQMLLQHFSEASGRIDKLSSLLPGKDDERKDFSSMPPMLSDILDMIADSHFMKLTLNRICDHSKDELTSSGVPENILTTVKSIDDFVINTAHTVEQVKISAPNLLWGGRLARKDYYLVQKLVFNLAEAVEKYTAIPWNSYLILESIDSEPTP